MTIYDAGPLAAGPGKEKVAKWSSAPASVLEGFNEIYAVYGPKKPYKTQEKRQSCQIDPCLPPYTSPLSPAPEQKKNKKYPKRPPSHFWPFEYFFGIFFRIFGAQSWAGDVFRRHASREVQTVN